VLDDRGGPGIDVDVGGEAAVELELIRGQVPEVGQRAVARAVVVDGRADAEPAELAEHPAAPVGVGHEGVLDQFQGQRLRGQAMPSQGVGDLAR